MKPTLRHNILVTIGLIVLWTLLVIAVVFVEALWFAHPAVVRGDLASIERHLVQPLNDAAVNKRLGSAALVLIQGGRVVAEHGFGVANADTQVAVKADQTLFQIGSASKAVTAWGVMKLVQEGKLGLDEPVMHHLKRWRFRGSDAFRDKVTVRHLLSHTAGLDDGLDYAGFPPGETMQTLEESLTMTNDPAMGPPRAVIVTREPGHSMAYSGGGYTVLQLLVEEVTQRPFADYMKEAVLQPLGMTKASFELDAIKQDLAPSFDAALKPHPHQHYTAVAAASFYSTPRHLAQLLLAYTRENPVLNQVTLKQMMSPQPGTEGAWGLGHELYLENDVRAHVVGRSGAAYPDWGAWIRLNPATGNGFVLTVSGGREQFNQLVHDWIYWETGKVTAEAQLQIIQDRLTSAAVAIIVGTILIVLWKFLRYRSRNKPVQQAMT